MNPPPTAREIGRIWFEQGWNGRDPSTVRDLLADDAVGHLEGGRQIVGPEEFLAFQAEFLAALPDIHIVIEDLLADDAAVCVHWTARGTHTGPGLGMAPSGTEVSFRGVTWLQTRDGRIVSGRDFWNMEGLMQTMLKASNAAQGLA